MNPSLEDTLRSIEPVDRAALQRYQDRLDQLTKPEGSLGRLEEIASRLGAIRWFRENHGRADLRSEDIVAGTGSRSQRSKPGSGAASGGQAQVSDLSSRDGGTGARSADSFPADLAFGNKAIFTFAADHGVAQRGVSLYPSEVTAQMVRNFLAGGAAINVLCRHYGITNVVVDVGVNADFGDLEGLRRHKVAKGTRDFTQSPAMTRHQALQAMQAGIDLAREFAQEDFRVLGTGEMGIGNTTAASAIFSALTGLDPEQTTGAGTGIGQRQRSRKVELIRQALRLHQPEPSDPVGVLSAVGGFEIAAIAGMVLGGASQRCAVVVDGFISTAGAAVALSLSPPAGDYLFFSHCSNESGHARILRWLGVRPLFDLDLRLGEGTGSAIAIDLLQASWKLLNQMATFEQASVSKSS